MQDPIGSFWCGKASKMALPIRTHALSLAHTHVRKATARSSLKFTSTHANSLAHSHVRKLHTARSSNNSCSHARTFIRLHTRSSQAHCKIFQYQFFPKKPPTQNNINRLVGSAAAHMVLAVAMRGALLSASIRFIELYSQGKSVDASTLIRCTP